MKILRKSTDSVLFGVCGGIAEWIGIDPTIVRLLFALLWFFSNGTTMVFVYIVLALIMPNAENGDGDDLSATQG